jgi:signal transduction histidine kinase
MAPMRSARLDDDGATAPHGVAVLDSSGRYLWLDDGACSLLGARPAELIGTPSVFTLPAGSREVWWVDESFGAAGRVVCHLRQTTHARWTLGLTTCPANLTDVAIVPDFADAVRAIVQDPDRDVVARELTEEFSRLSGVRGGIMVLIDPETGDPIFAGGSSRREQLAAMEECRRLGAPMVIWSAFSEGRVVVERHWITTILTDSRLAPLRQFIDDQSAGDLMDGSYVAIPLRVAGEPVGTMAGMVVDGSVDAPLIARWHDLAGQLALGLKYWDAIVSARSSGADRERKRLNEQLHDTVSQDLFALSLLAARAEVDVRSTGRSDIVDETHEVRRLADQVSADVRALIEDRRQDRLSGGLRERLSILASDVASRSGIEVGVDIPDDGIDFSADFIDDVFRIVQEALRNIVKHSHARHATLRVVEDPRNPGLLLVEIIDDGKGFDPKSTGAGSFGLLSIRERALEQGGSVEIRNAPSTTLRIRMRPVYASEWDAAHREL